MTKWADPISNPEQNERYWRERRRSEWLVAILLASTFCAFLGWIVWDTHRIVSCITDETPRSECQRTTPSRPE